MNSPLRTLTERELKVVAMRAQGMTLRQMAEKYNVTAGRVRQIESKAQAKLSRLRYVPDGELPDADAPRK